MNPCQSYSIQGSVTLDLSSGKLSYWGRREAYFETSLWNCRENSNSSDCELIFSMAQPDRAISCWYFDLSCTQSKVVINHLPKWKWVTSIQFYFRTNQLSHHNCCVLPIKQKDSSDYYFHIISQQISCKIDMVRKISTVFKFNDCTSILHCFEVARVVLDGCRTLFYLKPFSWIIWLMHIIIKTSFQKPVRSKGLFRWWFRKDEKIRSRHFQQSLKDKRSFRYSPEPIFPNTNWVSIFNILLARYWFEVSVAQIDWHLFVS